MSSDFDVRHAAPGDCLESLRLMQALVEFEGYADRLLEHCSNGAHDLIIDGAPVAFRCAAATSRTLRSVHRPA